MIEEERIISFGNLPPMPDGYYVIQLESGHYMATNGTVESCITVNRFHARKWTFQLASSQLDNPEEKV